MYSFLSNALHNLFFSLVCCFGLILLFLCCKIQQRCFAFVCVVTCTECIDYYTMSCISSYRGSQSVVILNHDLMFGTHISISMYTVEKCLLQNIPALL